jgi:hypothetical protein
MVRVRLDCGDLRTIASYFAVDSAWIAQRCAAPSRKLMCAEGKGGGQARGCKAVKRTLIGPADDCRRHGYHIFTRPGFSKQDARQKPCLLLWSRSCKYCTWCIQVYLTSRPVKARCRGPQAGSGAPAWPAPQRKRGAATQAAALGRAASAAGRQSSCRRPAGRRGLAGTCGGGTCETHTYLSHVTFAGRRNLAAAYAGPSFHCAVTRV